MNTQAPKPAPQYDRCPICGVGPCPECQEREDRVCIPKEQVR